MNRSADVLTIEGLDVFRGNVRRHGDVVASCLEAAEHEIKRVSDGLRQEEAHWKREVRRREAELAWAERQLQMCMSSGGEDGPPPCGAFEAEVVRAAKRLAEAEEELREVREWIRRLDAAVYAYHQRAEPLRSFLRAEIPRAVGFLGESIAALDHYTALQALRVAPSTIEELE